MKTMEFGFAVDGVSVRLQINPMEQAQPVVIAHPVEIASDPPAVKRRLMAPARRKPARTPERMTVTDAIRKVIAEAPRTNAEVYDHVRELLPEALKETVHTVLSQLRSRGEIAKKDDLKWYPIVRRER